ncbi:MAG TPA: MarR family transcriptional regulator [Gemmatimonadaceae bacterium]|nr:MarR family transcriptional regulator [Gemmatimonadaceae bacterium]
MQAADVLSGVRRLERGLRLAARAAERATGLTAAQLFVLEELAAAESSSLSDLASRTHTDRSSVSVVLDRLAAAGLVKRSPSSDDRRRTESQITRRGRAVLARAPLSPTKRLVRAVGRLPATKVHQLATALAALNDELGYTHEAMLFEEERK